MPTYWTFAASTILIGLGAVTILTTANGYVQTTTEPDLRGRVMALYMAILVGGTPIGAPIVGAVAAQWGPRWALGVAAIAAGVAALIGLGWLVFARGMHLARHPQVRWRPVLQFADAPTAAIAVIPTRPVHVVPAKPRPVPEDFSEQVALTSPIALPRHPLADREASTHDATHHVPPHHEALPPEAAHHPPSQHEPSRHVAAPRPRSSHEPRPSNAGCRPAAE
jgi:hypothetical protein